MMITIIGLLIYPVIGLLIGELSWYVWGRDIKFTHTEKIGDNRSYHYSVHWSLGLAILFPTTSRRTRFELSEGGSLIQRFGSDFLKRKLDSEKHNFCMLVIMAAWPLKVAFNLFVMLLGAIRMALNMLVGLLLLVPELTSGKKFGKSYLVKNIPKLRPPQPDDHVEEKRLPVTTTYAERLAELNAEREKALKRAEELECVIHKVEREMYDSQGGPHRTSPNIPMRSLEIGKRQPT